MKSTKNIFLMLASIAFIIVIGAGAYEIVAVVPRWSASPPLSLTMLQGKYGLNAGLFWMNIHPLTLLLLVTALISNWKTVRRKGILFVLGGYLVIIALTAIYFVPELMRITHTPYSATVDPALQSSAALWKNLNLCRLVVMIVIALQLLTCLTKSTESNQS